MDQWKRARPFVVESLQRKKASGGAFLEEPASMLDYMTSGKSQGIAYDVEKQLLYQMTLVAVGTVTTFSSIVQVLYDLATYPNYIPVLRKELELLERDQDGYLTKDAVFAMQKMDSFIKESQRLHAPDLCKLPTFQTAPTNKLGICEACF